MTHNTLQTQFKPNASIAKPVLLGAGTALCVICVFLFSAGKPNPVWGQLWMIRPIIIVPITGAGGGVWFYLLNKYLGYRGSWQKILAIVLSLLGFLVALWLGIVLGLAGTMWH